MTKLSYHLQTYKSKAGENGNDSFLISMSVSVCALVFAVLLVESVMRIFLPIFGEESFSVKKDNAIFSPDPIITNKLKPNKEFGHDKNGFKNEKMLDSYKVVALGDSHTYGGLRKTPWTQYLAKELGTMVYNMGVAGYGMAQYYYLLNQALSFGPDHLIIALYLGNDIYNAYDVVYHNQGWEKFQKNDFVDTAPQTIIDHGKIKGQLLGDIRLWIRGHSYLYRFVSDRTRGIREWLGLALPWHTGTRDWTHPHPDAVLCYKEKPEIATCFWNGHRVRGLDLSNKNTREGLRLTKEFLKRMSDKTKDMGSILVIALLPTKQMAYREVVGAYGGQNEYYTSIIKNEIEIKEELKKWCQIHDIFCIDIAPSMQKMLRERKQLYPNSIDDHPTQAGYRLYAKTIAEYLKHR